MFNKYKKNEVKTIENVKIQFYNLNNYIDKMNNEFENSWSYIKDHLYNIYNKHNN